MIGLINSVGLALGGVGFPSSLLALRGRVIFGSLDPDGAGGKAGLADKTSSILSLASLGSSAALGDIAAASASLTAGGASAVLSDAATDLEISEDC